MEEEKWGVEGWIGVFLVLALFLGIGIKATDTWGFLVGQTGSTLANWVAGFGTIAAALVALNIASRTERQRVRHERSKAIVVATKILPLLERMAEELKGRPQKVEMMRQLKLPKTHVYVILCNPVKTARAISAGIPSEELVILHALPGNMAVNLARATGELVVLLEEIELATVESEWMGRSTTDELLAQFDVWAGEAERHPFPCHGMHGGPDITSSSLIAGFGESRGNRHAGLGQHWIFGSAK